MGKADSSVLSNGASRDSMKFQGRASFHAVVNLLRPSPDYLVATRRAVLVAKVERDR